MSPAPGFVPHCCFEVFTLFPAAIEGFVGAGLLGKAIEHGRVEVRCTDYRDYATDRHRSVDDSPFGGGAGMVIKPGPVLEALEHVEQQRGPVHRVLLTPSAPRFDQPAAARLAQRPRIGLLCGRYEGIDDRIRDHYVDECLSLGDFVLAGGEVAALTIIEAVTRLVDGVVGNPDSVRADSFGLAGQERWLEHPHYTRPADFRGHRVPEVLLGGDHRAITQWRHREALARTWRIRPDLRGRPQLAPEHPVYLVVTGGARPEAAALAAVARHHSVTGLAVIGVDPEQIPDWANATKGRVRVASFDTPKALARRLRRGAGGVPRWIRLVEPDPARGEDAEQSADALLDRLQTQPGAGPLGPLLLWLGPGEIPPSLPDCVEYAPALLPRGARLTGPDAGSSDGGLAIERVIADISRPCPPTIALAHAALTRLRDRE